MTPATIVLPVTISPPPTTTTTTTTATTTRTQFIVPSKRQLVLRVLLRVLLVLMILVLHRNKKNKKHTNDHAGRTLWGFSPQTIILWMANTRFKMVVPNHYLVQSNLRLNMAELHNRKPRVISQAEECIARTR
jgi:hypothetical protein